MDVLPSDRLGRVLNVDFDQNFKSAVDRFSCKMHCLKGDTLIRQGDELNTLYFIVRGIVRGFYLDQDGKEITKCFSKENEFAGTEGLLGATKASFSVSCLEHVDCIAIPYQVISSDPDIDKQVREILGEATKQWLLDLEYQKRDLFILNAESRYRNFLEKYKAIQHRIKQSDIASYIGIQPSSLSRIKRKIKIRRKIDIG